MTLYRERDSYKTRAYLLAIEEVRVHLIDLREVNVGEEVDVRTEI